MLNLIVNGARVSYDSLEEAKDAARESGLAFWRETLTECAENEAMWNEFLNDLWQSGAEDEAERLDRTFPKDAPRHWLLVALTLDGDDPWEAFLAEWEAQGDERILPVVSSPAFAPWLKQVRTKKHDLLVRAFGADAAKWPIDLLQKALKAEGTEAEIAEWKTLVEKRKEPRPGDEMTITLPGGVPMTFCWCPATTSEAWKKISGGEDFFWMGSPESEPNRLSNETRHRVKLTNGFWMGKYPVTQRQWMSVMGSNPSSFSDEDRPVGRVSWGSCQEFVRKVNSATREMVALPTEAQWEYACRAGSTTAYGYEMFSITLNTDNGNSAESVLCGMPIADSCCESSSPIGSDRQNAWGLAEMNGFDFEWCQDVYGDYIGDATDPMGPISGDSRVCRGGLWGDIKFLGCRSAARAGLVPVACNDDLGIRLVCGVRSCC